MRPDKPLKNLLSLGAAGESETHRTARGGAGRRVPAWWYNKASAFKGYSLKLWRENEILDADDPGCGGRSGDRGWLGLWCGSVSQTTARAALRGDQDSPEGWRSVTGVGYPQSPTDLPSDG